MSTRNLIFVALFGLASSGCVLADQFQFDSPGSNVWNGVYVNPYYAHQTPGGVPDSLQIYCDDWNTEFSGNPTWNATIYPLTEANVQYFKFGKITSAYDVAEVGSMLKYTAAAVTPLDIYHRYLEVAWLDEQIKKSGANGTKQELSAAMWTLFVDPQHVAGLIDNGINVSGTTFVNDVSLDLSNAFAAVTNSSNPYTAPGWSVIVPNRGVNMQEFLAYQAPVPEPEAVVLLGSVLGLLGITGFRRKRSS